MKNRILLVVLVLFSGMFSLTLLNGQTPFVNQVVTANSGKFEFSPPFQDYVTLQTYNPGNQVSADFHTIFTQSAQDICIKGNTAFIAAQDSLIKINLDTYQRLAAIADSGLNKLLVFGDKIVVSKQYPTSTFFAEVLRADDLSLVASIPGISGDCGSMTAVGDSVYIAVNGGWMGTEGKIAVIETTGWTVAREINLGPEAVGTMSIYHFDGKLFTVNKSPFSSPDAGSVSIYDLDSHSVVNSLMSKNVGTGAGVDGNLLYFGLGYGIGSFNMTTLQVEDEVVVPDPGSAMFKYITSATVDTLNNLIYMNVGDYATPGTCHVYSLAGDSVAAYITGISADAVAIDYRGSLGIENHEGLAPALSVYPNPVSDRMKIGLTGGEDILDIQVTDCMGRIVVRQVCEHRGSSAVLMANMLPSGIYLVTVITQNGTRSGKFIKK